MNVSNQNQSFKFNNYGHFASEAPHIDTKALLNKGSMDVEGTKYKVTLASDDSISVKPEKQSKSKAKRFFGGASELFSHRLGDDSSSSRSKRMADALNHRKSVEARLDNFKNSQNTSTRSHGESSSSGAAREPYRFTMDPQHSQTMPHYSASAALAENQTPLGLENFMQDEEHRANYYNERPLSAYATSSYQNYQSNNNFFTSMGIFDSVNTRQNEPQDLNYFTDLDYFDRSGKN